MKLTQAKLKDILFYNKKTGEWLWIRQRGDKIRPGMKAGKNQYHKNTVYRSIVIDYQDYLVHRLAWLYVYGNWPVNEIDHIDGNGLNNALSNLRDVTRLESSRNRAVSIRTNSGIMGIQKSGKRWKARLCQEYLGTFDDWFDAVCARKSAEYKRGFDANHGRSRS